MRRYGRAEIERFLTDLDAGLDRRQEVVLIGWASAILGYGAPGETIDIDAWSDLSGLQASVDRVVSAGGLRIPFATAGVADPPREFEGRLRRVLPHLRRLTVLVPEKHDLALMKAVRGLEHDLAALERLHRVSPLDCDTLVSRFQEEMGQAIGDPRRLRGNFLGLIERLFPERVEGVARRLRQVRPGR